MDTTRKKKRVVCLAYGRKIWRGAFSLVWFAWLKNAQNAQTPQAWWQSQPQQTQKQSQPASSAQPQPQQKQAPQAQNFDNLRPGDNWDKAIIDDNFPNDDDIPF